MVERPDPAAIPGVEADGGPAARRVVGGVGHALDQSEASAAPADQSQSTWASSTRRCAGPSPTGTQSCLLSSPPSQPHLLMAPPRTPEYSPTCHHHQSTNQKTVLHQLTNHSPVPRSTLPLAIIINQPCIHVSNVANSPVFGCPISCKLQRPANQAAFAASSFSS